MSAQKLLRAALAIDRNRECKLRRADFSGFKIRSAVQDSLKFHNEIQVVEDLVAFILPGGQGNRLRQELSPAVGVLAHPSRPARPKCDGRGLQRILKQAPHAESPP